MAFHVFLVLVTKKGVLRETFVSQRSSSQTTLGSSGSSQSGLDQNLIPKPN